MRKDRTKRTVEPTEPTATGLPADDHQGTSVIESATKLGQRSIASDVEDHVISATAVRDLLAGVVDNLIGTDGSDELDLPCAAHAGDLGTEDLGDLHREPLRGGINHQIIGSRTTTL